MTKFLLFVAYVTGIFFLPNGWWVMMGVIVNLVWTAWTCAGNWGLLRKIWRGTLKILPFVALTIVFNWWLDSWQSAVWLAAKLIIVCNATMIYAAKMTTVEVADVLAKLCRPLRFLGIEQNDVKVLVVVALMMIPILRKELREMREACKAKGASWNLATLELVLQKTGWSLLGRVNQIEEGLLAKGIKLE